MGGSFDCGGSCVNWSRLRKSIPRLATPPLTKVTFSASSQSTFHYGLRPIEGVQFRFDNFDSHFIRVQIFQIDFSTLLLILSAYKYFRLILKRPNEHFSISVWHFHAKETFMKQFMKEKRTSWTLLNDYHIWSKQVAQRFLQNNICFFRSPISPWRGPHPTSLFRAFFLDMVYIFTMPKISLGWGPLQAFLNIARDFGNICFLKKLRNYLVAKYGS